MNKYQIPEVYEREVIRPRFERLARRMRHAPGCAGVDVQSVEFDPEKKTVRVQMHVTTTVPALLVSLQELLDGLSWDI